MSLTPEEIERRQLLFYHPKTREELHAWVLNLLDVDLPGTIVDPDTNCTPLDMVWQCYSHFMYPPENPEDLPPERLYYANRFGGKTLAVAIIEVLALLHVGTDVVHLAAVEEQSLDAQRYLKGFMQRPDLMGLMVGDAVRNTVVVYHEPIEGDGPRLTDREWRGLPEEDRKVYRRRSNWATVVVATIKSVNGKHAGLVIEDEFDLIENPRVISESKNIPTPIRAARGRYRAPLSIQTSTRKSSVGPVQKAIDRKNETGLYVGFWNILSTTQRCPTSKHQPEKLRLPIYRSDESLRAVDEDTWRAMDPKTQETFVRDEGYHGCLHNCKIFSACRGLLATRPEEDNEFLKPLYETINKFRVNDLDTAKSQLLCRKPSSKGLIYGNMIDARHVLTPAEAYRAVFGVDPSASDVVFTKAALTQALLEADRDVQWYGGQDYGFSHFFAFPVGFRFGNRFFFTRCLAQAELNPTEKLTYSEPLRPLNPTVYGDPESPGDIDMFKKAGWNMRTWSKIKGSVLTGINIFKAKLAPLGEAPEVYFVHDVGEDPEMALMLAHLKAHKWALDAAGNPTDKPVDDETKDIADGARYCIQNVFPHRLGGVKTVDTTEADVRPKTVGTVQPTPGRPNSRMLEIIGDLTGGGPPPEAPVGRKGRLSFIP